MGTVCVSVPGEGRDAEAVLPVVGRLAPGLAGARAGRAQGNTLLPGLVTALGIAAVIVVAAVDLHAMDVGVALETGPADTLGPVALDLAVSILAAVRPETGVHTLLGDAGLVQRAVRIDLALICLWQNNVKILDTPQVAF